MNELRTLAVLELRSCFGINRSRYTKDPKAKKRFRLLCAVWALLLLMAIGYVAGLVFGLISLGLGQIVPAYLALLASALVLAFGIFKAGAAVFSPKGWDLLSAMPIRRSNLVLARFLRLYAEDLALSCLILLPGLITFAVLYRPGFSFYLSSLCGIFLIPMIPLVISLLFGTLIMAISSRMKHKSLVQTALALIFVAVTLAGSVWMGQFSEDVSLEQLSDLASNIGRLLGTFYPPARWLGEAMSGNLMSLLLLSFVSAGSLTLTVFLVIRCHASIMNRLQSFSAEHSYTIGTMEHKGVIRALYLREVRRYFSSSIYVTNTIIGPILGAALAAGLLFNGPETVFAALGMDLRHLIPYVFSAAFTMMTTTSTSISMEGRQFWVIRSLPISTKVFLDGKYLLNLSLMAPFYLIMEVLLTAAMKPDALELLWQLLIPGAIMLLCVVFGITANLWLHSFDWEREEQVVKQSASSALGGFAGLLLSLFLGLITFLVPSGYRDLSQALILVLLLGSALWLYRRNQAADLAVL